jgi:hypothetical protein
MAFDTPTLDAPKISTARANQDSLKKKFYAAAGPQYHDPQRGNIGTNGNPHMPQNAPSQWVTEFGDKMAEAVAEVVDAVAGAVSIEQSDLSEPFRALASSVSEYVDTTLKAVSAATAGLQRRTNLLWWKEALFSPSARLSYRDLPRAVAAALMAYDLQQQVPTFSPASVAAFLFEAVIGLPTVEQDKTFPIRELVEEAQRHAGLASLRAWATWIFREMQAAAAAYDSVSPKRRGRKG